MNISARVTNRLNQHDVQVQTNGISRSISIPPKAEGYGSSVNGAELLLLALATCYCNDIYREASAFGIKIEGVEVTCQGKFGAAGEAGSDFIYTVKIHSDAPESEIESLILHTDRVAEIQRTLRNGAAISIIHEK